MVKGNVATSNDQNSTPSEEEQDIKTSFAITELEDDPGESQAELANYFNKLDKKLKKNWRVVLMNLGRISMKAQFS